MKLKLAFFHTAADAGISTEGGSRELCGVQVTLDLHVSYALVPPCNDREEKELNLGN